MSEPMEVLANAIILQSVKDYREAIKKLKRNSKNQDAKHTIIEVERFFHSAWYRELTSVDGDFLMKKLRMEVNAK